MIAVLRNMIFFVRTAIMAVVLYIQQSAFLKLFALFEAITVGHLRLSLLRSASALDT